MRLWIARAGGLAVRDQLVAKLLLAILSGDLRPGQRLPSTRDLARRLKVHANTVSAAYSELEREGWVASRRGSGVYVRSRERQAPDDPDTALDQFIADLFRSARDRGIPLRRVHNRLRRWLTLHPPDHFAVIEPDEELGRILTTEIEAAVEFPAVTLTPEACREPEALTGAIPVVLLSKYEALRAALPPGAECVALNVRSVPGSLADWMPIPADALIVVASRWQGFLKWARVMLVSAGAHPDSVELRDARRARWRHGLDEATIVIADVVTAANVPRGCRILTFPMIAETSIEALRQHSRFATLPGTTEK
jgi:GntR family transcriptional regulator